VASVDARINITADSRPAEREIERLANQIARVQRSAFIPIDNLIRVGSVEKSIQTINQLENAVVSLRSQIRSISAPGGGGGLGNALGDSIRTAATAANEFFDSLVSGRRSLSNTISGLKEQSNAFVALAANISSADARFTDYIQGAQAAQDKGLRPLFSQFRALQRLYEEGITGRNVEITSGEVGANLFESLSREIPQTEGALKAFSAELQRVRSLISSESTSALGIEQLMLETEQQLLRIEEDRLQVRAAMNRELSAPVQGALSRMEGTGPNPFGISGEQINDSLNQRAEKYQQNLEEIARVTQSLASMESKRYDPLGISDQQINAGLNERASQLVQQRDELGSLQQVLSAMEGKKYDPLNISDQQINAGLDERASLYQRQTRELANLQAVLGAMQGRKADPLGISDEQVNATLNQRAEIFERQTRDTEALQGALGSLESRKVNWATALGIKEADIAADGAQRLASEWNRLQAEADGLAARAPEAAAALRAFKFESLAEGANSYTRALLNQQRTLDEYADAAGRAARAARELGYGGELPALRPAGFTDQDARIKNLLDDQTRSADIVADYERKAEMLINDLEMDNIQRQLNAELDSIETTLNARKKAGEQWWSQQKTFLDQKTKIEEQQAKRAQLPFLEQRFGKRGSAAISEGLIGGAFPLLFGQGAGAAAGGLAGGVAGGFAGGGLGFGLSLIGTALGTAFDTLSQAAQDTGKALNYPIEGFENLKTAGLFAGRQQEYYISKLIETGQTARATAEIQARIVEVIGVQGANDLMDLGDSASVLSKKWAELGFQMQVLVAGPVGDFLNLLARVAGAKVESNTMTGLGERISKLTPEQRKAFQQESKAFSGPDYVKGAEAILNRIAPQQLKETKKDPVQQVADLDKAIEKADKARSLVQQGVALERGAVELRLSIEDTVYGLRKRATDMEREAIEFRRSVEDQIFGRRQELEQKLIENERKRQQNAIDAFDLQLQKASTGLDPIAQGVVDAARDYLRIRAEGEADLQQAEKQLKLELQQIDQEVNRYKLQVEDRVSQMAIQRDEFSRDVTRARLQIENQIADRVVQVEEYRLAMAKHRYEMEIDLEKKKQVVAQEGLAVQATGGYTGTTVDGFPITSRAGMRRHPITGEMREHRGVDVAAPTGTALGYEIGGEILSAGWIKGYGNTLKVKLENGMTVLSAHLNEIFVTAGQKFQANQRLATVGSTGNSTGPHTHQESWMNGKADPYASLPFLQLGKAVSGKQDSDIYLQPGVGYFSRRTGLMVRGIAGGAGQAASAGASAQVALGAAGTAPALQAAAAMPVLPSAPQLVGINDLMQQYLEIVKRIKAATADTNKIEIESNAIAAERARLALQEQAMSSVRQAEQQTREIYEEIEARKLRNRLALEGFAPEIIEGEIRVLGLQRDLTKAVKGYDIVLAELIGTTYDGTTATYESAVSKLSELEALGQLTPAQKALREELEKILKARQGISDATSEAIEGAKGAAEASVPQYGDKLRSFIADGQKELKDLEQVAINVSQSIGNAVGNSLARGISGLVEGTTSAKEVFANFLKDISEILIQEGTRMIAMYIAIAIAKAIAGMSGGGNAAAKLGSNPNVAAYAPLPAAANGATFANGIAQFANGGAFTNSIVSSPTLFQFADGGVTRMGEMGEDGPEAIMPLKRGPDGRLGVDASGMAVPYQRSAAAATTPEMEVPYRGNGPALAVPYLRSAGSAGGDSMNGTIDVKFETVRIGGVDYVTRDEAEQIGRESAIRGADLASKRYRQNPSARRRDGIG